MNSFTFPDPIWVPGSTPFPRQPSPEWPVGQPSTPQSPGLCASPLSPVSPLPSVSPVEPESTDVGEQEQEQGQEQDTTLSPETIFMLSNLFNTFGDISPLPPPFGSPPMSPFGSPLGSPPVSPFGSPLRSPFGSPSDWIDTFDPDVVWDLDGGIFVMPRSPPTSSPENPDFFVCYADVISENILNDYDDIFVMDD